MRRVIFWSLVVCCAILSFTGPSAASEIDDADVSRLFSAADKVRSYGDFCWEVKFNRDWTLPESSPFSDGRDFSFYAMDVKAVDRPVTGDYSYPDYIRQFIPLRERVFKAGDRILIVCLPKDLKFADFREHVFKPWVVQGNKGRSKEWTFIKSGPKWLAKSTWHVNHAWLTGTRAVQDFVCLGADDKNIVAIDANSITFTPRTAVCFTANHHKGDNPYLQIWTDEDGKPMRGYSLEPDRQVTLKVDPLPRPKGWD